MVTKLSLQPRALRVKVGETLDLFAQVRGAGDWPQPTWDSQDDAICTVAPGVGNNAAVTGVALGTSWVSATVAGLTSYCSIDVVPAAPASVTVVPAGENDPHPWVRP